MDEMFCWEPYLRWAHADAYRDYTARVVRVHL